MPEENARLDYFRSEIKGDIARLEKQQLERNTENLRVLREFEKRLDKITSDLKNFEMSVR